MVRLKRRLDELVADAGECHLRGGAVHDWVAGPWPNWAARFAWLALTVAEGAAGAARQGDYRRARKLAELNAVYLPEWAADALDSEVSLEGCAAWAAFRAACELAERIDCFLAAVGRGPQGAGLAADCRECLETLLVLADWCDDRGQPAAAAEARRLHALACGLG